MDRRLPPEFDVEWGKFLGELGHLLTPAMIFLITTCFPVQVPRWAKVGPDVASCISLEILFGVNELLSTQRYKNTDAARLTSKFCRRWRDVVIDELQRRAAELALVEQAVALREQARATTHVQSAAAPMQPVASPLRPATAPLRPATAPVQSATAPVQPAGANAQPPPPHGSEDDPLEILKSQCEEKFAHLRGTLIQRFGLMELFLLALAFGFEPAASALDVFRLLEDQKKFCHENVSPLFEFALHASIHGTEPWKSILKDLKDLKDLTASAFGDSPQCDMLRRTEFAVSAVQLLKSIDEKYPQVLDYLRERPEFLSTIGSCLTFSSTLESLRRAGLFGAGNLGPVVRALNAHSSFQSPELLPSLTELNRLDAADQSHWS